MTSEYLHRPQMEELLADPFLTLYDQNENRLDYNDDTFGYDPFIGGFVAGYNGDHYLEVKRYSDAGTYTVLAQEGQELIDDHLNDLITTSRLSIGKLMHGELEAFGDEKDMFVVNLEEGQTYDFRVFALDSGGGSLDDPILTLYDQNENRLDYNDDTFGYDPLIKSFVAAYDGEHYLALGGYGEVGTYTILAVGNNIIL